MSIMRKEKYPELKYDMINHFYLINNNDNRIGCLAIGYDKEKKILTITASLCSILDNFSSKTARNIALNRLRSGNPKTRKYVITKAFVNTIHTVTTELVRFEYTVKMILIELKLRNEEFAINFDQLNFKINNEKFIHVVQFMVNGKKSK